MITDRKITYALIVVDYSPQKPDASRVKSQLEETMKADEGEASRTITRWLKHTH